MTYTLSQLVIGNWILECTDPTSTPQKGTPAWTLWREFDVWLQETYSAKKFIITPNCFGATLVQLQIQKCRKTKGFYYALKMKA